MLDSIPDDYFTYLCNNDYPYFKTYTYLFLTCNKLYLLNKTYINNLVNSNYKLLIKNNHIENPKRIHNCIYEVYGSKFIMCKFKLNDLAIKSISTDNIELLKLLYKIAPNTMKSEELKLDMFRSAFNIKSPQIVNYLLSQSPSLPRDEMERIIKHYFCNQINSPILLINIILLNDPHHICGTKELVIESALRHNDLSMLQLLMNDNDATELLIRSIKMNNIRTSANIMQNLKYDKNKFFEVIYPYKESYTYMFNVLSMIDHEKLNQVIFIS